MTVLGQLLIKSGLVTHREVDAALRRQEQLGGRLGTCLLELGAITEWQLEAALAKQLGLPAARVEDLNVIREDVHSLLPANLAISCEAVPFRVRDDQVDIAILEIKNRGLHDELAFVIGKWIHVHIANEVRIFQALQRYYGRDSTLRYRTLLERLDQERENIGDAEKQKLVDLPFPDLETAEPSAPTGPKLIYPPAPVTRRSIELTTEERADLKRAAPPSPTEMPKPGLPVEPPTAAPTPAQTPSPPQPAPSEGATIEDHPSAPWSVESVPQVGKKLLRELGRHFKNAALFRIQKERVVGWTSAGERLDRARVEQYTARLDQSSVFSNLVDGGQLFIGRLSPSPVHDELMAVLRSNVEIDCLVSVIAVEGRGVAIAYGDRDREGLDTLDFAAVQQVANKAGAALRELILRRKRKQA